MTTTNNSDLYALLESDLDAVIIEDHVSGENIIKSPWIIAKLKAWIAAAPAGKERRLITDTYPVTDEFGLTSSHVDTVISAMEGSVIVDQVWYITHTRQQHEWFVTKTGHGKCNALIDLYTKILKLTPNTSSQEPTNTPA